MDLPRVAPRAGCMFRESSFPEGMVFSAPICTVHRDPEIWGSNAEVFRPERWCGLDQARAREILHPFSLNPWSAELRDLPHV